MLKKLSEQKFFEKFIKLSGKRIRLVLKSQGIELDGTVINAMFDSFLIQTKKGNQVVRYDDLLFFEKAEEA
jgi:hypothetical protein